MGFKGQHANKLHITYTKEGDRFQCHCIADDGYTFPVYFRNQPAPKKWLDEGYSPLHSRCMALFDYFMEEHHQVRFDNLYMSAKFALESFQHRKKTMIEGVSWLSNCEVPTQIHQQEVTTRARIDAVKGTVKACVLEGVPALYSCPLVVCSIYDTKPVHFFSMCCDKIK